MLVVQLTEAEVTGNNNGRTKKTLKTTSNIKQEGI
jgi:hypothetical protein